MRESYLQKHAASPSMENTFFLVIPHFSLFLDFATAAGKKVVATTCLLCS
jgi:hypothetical protein